MSKPFTYWVRLAMVATMCTLVTFSPVSAGRWMDRLLHRDACKTTAIDCCDPIISCEMSSIMVPSAACVVMGQPACPTVTLGCDSMPSVPHATGGVSPTVETPESAMQSVVPSVVESTPAPVVPQSPVVEAPVVEAPVVEAPAPVVEKAPIAELVPVVPELKPVLESTPPVLNPFAPDTKQPEVKTEEPKPKDSTIDDLFGSDPKPEAPVTPAPVTPAPVTPAPVDDLFGTDPKPVAGETVAPKDDLFGADSKPETPVAPPLIDDLFGSDPKPVTPAAAAPVDELFGSDPKPTAPVTAEPIDDLFGDPKQAVPEAANSVESKPSDTADDVFKTKDKPAAEPSIDDLFGKPINIEVDLSNEKSNALPVDEDDAFIDSLFGKSPEASKSPAPKVDASDESPKLPDQAKPRSEKSPVDELDALFGVGEFKPASEFKGAEYRQWVDNSGSYQVNARLAVIYVDKIKLLKDNGKFTTVSLSRLSEADFGYVSWVASNLTGVQTARMVKTESRGVEPDVAR